MEDHKKENITGQEIADFSRRPLYSIFTRVTGHYDLINRLFTLRMDERWRKKAVKLLMENKPKRIMDLCTGTGDLAIHMARAAEDKAEVIGYDFSQPMLDIATNKSGSAGLGNIRFIHGDAADMPFPDGHFDAIGIAFAFRNLTYRNPNASHFIDEIHRVLKNGGRFVIVESSQPSNRIFRSLFRIYTRTMVYHLGSLISGDRRAYRYLANSVINYYAPEEIEDLMKSHGFSEVCHKKLLGGAAAIHIAVK